MTLISYAQNFEDIILWRALKHIENGFYIDVGAWSPDFDSVTRLLYERGWRGINIEPNPKAHAELQEQRIKDLNLCIAIGEKPGTQILNLVTDTGLSTLDETIARRHVEAGWIVKDLEVEVTTLADIWEQYVPEGQDVHILKVDVEGSEEAVIKGNQWLKYRPWIVVVEASFPMSQHENYVAWESILIAADYCFAYADGLNRFYVAKEHANLLPAFKYPPNVFDDFKLFSQQLVENELNAAKAKINNLNSEVHHWYNISDSLSLELHAMEASYCWRITSPLRNTFDFLIWVKARSTVKLQVFERVIKGMLYSTIDFLARFILVHPIIKAKALALLHRIPALEKWLNTQIPFVISDKYMEGLSDLTPDARRIYIQLKSAIEQKKNSRGH